jgi:general stress protein 26
MDCLAGDRRAGPTSMELRSSRVVSIWIGGLQMASMTREELSKQLKKLDFCMFSTRGTSNRITSRPMSNNGDVEYDGDSWFFSYADTHKISEIRKDPAVLLTFTAPPHLLGKPGIFIAIDGDAVLIEDTSQFETHWVKGLERWFPEGVQTPGLILIKVTARFAQYWDGEENGKVDL